MAIETKCQTPGAVFYTTIDPLFVEVQVNFPFTQDFTEEEAIELEANLHNALELVLKPYFTNR